MKKIALGNNPSPYFNDSSGSYRSILSWDNDGHIDYVMSQVSRAYVIGYTDQEIAAMKASGGKYPGYIIVKCD